PASLIELNCSINSLSSLPALPSSLVQLDCSSNNLSSIPTLPLTLTNLICNNNELSTLPTPSFLGALNVFLCQNNRLDYGDLEPYAFLVPILFADPQANFDIVPSSYVGSTGDNISIDGTLSGAGNLYEWFRDGVSLGPPSSSGILNLNGVTTADAGIYTLQVTNTIVFPFSLPEVESNPVIVNIDGFLPIDLLVFKAELLPSQEVLLRWTTANEINNAFFTLEKSKNARYFELFRKMDSQGNGNGQQSYEVIDPNPYPGFNYYRLSQTDQDGTTEYFPIVFVKNESPINLRVYPNPTHDWVFLENKNLASNSRPALISLIGGNGTILKTHLMEEDKESISLKGLPGGIYFLRIQLQGRQELLRIIKQ
ncbi:MAG: T9SS type A sorting domain-containing protein, partial [Bacteroidota bacterium]